MKASGIIIPMYIVIRMIGAIQNKIQRRCQDSDYDVAMSYEDDENEGSHDVNLIHS